MNYKILSIRLILFLCISILFTDSVVAQRTVIQGTVNDEAGATIVGVNVIEIDQNNRMFNGTITNMDGVFTIKSSIKGRRLKFSFIGFKEKIVELSAGKKNYEIVLEEETTELDAISVAAKKIEKVDMGYLSFSKEEATGAVSVIDIKEVAPSHVSDVGEMLQGQSSGLLVTSNSGDPGSGVSIRIRGSASLNANSNPLIVVDGVPTEIEGSFSNLEDFGDYSRSPLSDINPEDIESISVLKDASSTAIYGSRGANGVILIKTKRGKSGKTSVSFSAKFSTQPGKEYLPLLSGDDLKTLWLEMDQNAYGLGNSSITGTRPELRDDPARSDYEYFNNNTTWTDEITTDGFTQDYSVTVSGGGEAVKFSMNMGILDQSGNVVNTAYSKFTSSFKLDYVLSDKVRFSGNIYFTHHDWNRSKGFGTHDDPLTVAYRRPSFLPAYSPENPEEYSYFYWTDENNTANVNPMAQANNASNNKFTDNLKANISIQAQLFKGLSVNSYIAYSMGNTDYDVFFPYSSVLRTDSEGTPYVPWTDSSVNEFSSGNSYSQKLDASNTISYSLKNEKHNLTIAAIQSLLYSTSNSFAYSGSNTGSDDLQNPNATNNWSSISAGESEKAVIGLRGKLIYAFDKRYGIDVGMNTDAASNFGPDYRWGLFPNAGMYWRLSEESFMEGVHWLDDLKFRASWGQAGRSPSGSYSHLSTYSRGENGYNGDNFVIPGNTQLSELRWETSETTDIGVEMSLFKNRLYVELGYYKQSTFDLLTTRSYPSSSGINDKKMALLKNFGDMSNKGYEMSVNVSPVKTKNWSWDLRFNMATSESKITRWPTQETEWSSAGEESSPKRYSSSDDYAFYARVREGDPLGAFYGYEVDKKMPVYSTSDDVLVYGADGKVVYDTNGDVMRKYNQYSRGYFEAGDMNYVDQNHDGKINDLDIVYLGDSNPDMFGGISSTLRYKGWSMGLFFNYMLGQDILNWTRYGGELLKKPQNYTTSVMRRWRKPGDITDIPRAVNGSIRSYNNELGGDKYVEDGSFLRLQTLSLTYMLPREFLKKSVIKNSSLTFSAYNLFVWTNYTGVDPEVSYAGKQFDVGVDNSKTPKQSSYTINLKLGF